MVTIEFAVTMRVRACNMLLRLPKQSRSQSVIVLFTIIYAVR